MNEWLPFGVLFGDDMRSGEERQAGAANDPDGATPSLTLCFLWLVEKQRTLNAQRKGIVEKAAVFHAVV